MENLPDVSVNLIDEKKASILRRYFVEVAVLGLATVVVFLFFKFNALNEYIRSDLTQMRERNAVLIENNTRVVEQNTAALQDIRAAIKAKN